MGSSTLIFLFITLSLVSVVFSMLGLGGGSLYTPIQVFLGIDFHHAATTSLFLIAIGSTSAAYVFGKAKKIDWPLVIALEIFSVSGALLGGLKSDLVSDEVLSIMFSVTLTVAAFFLVFDISIGRDRTVSKSGFLVWQRSLGSEVFSVNLLFAFPAAFIAGTMSALLGIGGGIIKVPIMVLVCGVPMGIAVACSAVMVAITASAAFVGHAMLGHWQWEISLILVTGVFIGGQIGARLSIRMDKKLLKRLFGWLIMVVAIAMSARLFFLSQL